MVPSGNSKPFANESTTMWFDDEGIFCSVSHKVQKVDKAALEITFDYIRKNKSSEKILWLGDVSEVSAVDKEAREFAARETPKFIKALAAITNSSVSKLLADLFLIVYKPPYPTKLFTNEAEAREWLKKFK